MRLSGFRLSEAEWAKRNRGVTSGLEEVRTEALVVYGTGQHHLLLPDYVLFCSGFLGIGTHTFLVLVPGETPELFVAERADVTRAEVVAWMATVTYAPDPGAAAVGRLRQQGVRRVALAGRRWMPYDTFRAFTETLGQEVAVLSGDALLEEMARVKGPEERKRVSQAAAIADAAFAALLAAARPGVADYELAAEVEYVIKCLGASDNFGLISAGARNEAGHPPTGHRLAPGDVILAEITPCYGGYFAQLCRSIVVGNLLPQQKRDAALQHRVLTETLAAVRPGRSAATIARTMNRIMSDAGYGIYSHPPYMRSRGHGLGFGSTSPGELTEDNEQVIEEGMTFVVHPNQYFPDSGYLILGDTIEVVADGVQTPLQTPAQIFTV